jgi:hypothetical protein
MRSSNLQEIYEFHLSFSLIIPVFVLLLDARTTLCVARARVHLEKVVELDRFVRVCGSDCNPKINKPFYHQCKIYIYTYICMHQWNTQAKVSTAPSLVVER